MKHVGASEALESRPEPLKALSPHSFRASRCARPVGGSLALLLAFPVATMLHLGCMSKVEAFGGLVKLRKIAANFERAKKAVQYQIIIFRHLFGPFLEA